MELHQNRVSGTCYPYAVLSKTCEPNIAAITRALRAYVSRKCRGQESNTLLLSKILFTTLQHQTQLQRHSTLFAPPEGDCADADADCEAGGAESVLDKSSVVEIARVYSCYPAVHVTPEHMRIPQSELDKLSTNLPPGFTFERTVVSERQVSPTGPHVHGEGGKRNVTTQWAQHLSNLFILTLSQRHAPIIGRLIQSADVSDRHLYLEIPNTAFSIKFLQTALNCNATLRPAFMRMPKVRSDFETFDMSNTLPSIPEGCIFHIACVKMERAESGQDDAEAASGGVAFTVVNYAADSLTKEAGNLTGFENTAIIYCVCKKSTDLSTATEFAEVNTMFEDETPLVRRISGISPCEIVCSGLDLRLDWEKRASTLLTRANSDWLEDLKTCLYRREFVRTMVAEYGWTVSDADTLLDAVVDGKNEAVNGVSAVSKADLLEACSVKVDKWLGESVISRLAFMNDGICDEDTLRVVPFVLNIRTGWIGDEGDRKERACTMSDLVKRYVFDVMLCSPDTRVVTDDASFNIELCVDTAPGISDGMYPICKSNIVSRLMRNAVEKFPDVLETKVADVIAMDAEQREVLCEKAEALDCADLVGVLRTDGDLYARELKQPLLKFLCKQAEANTRVECIEDFPSVDVSSSRLVQFLLRGFRDHFGFLPLSPYSNNRPMSMLWSGTHNSWLHYVYHVHKLVCEQRGENNRDGFFDMPDDGSSIMVLSTPFYNVAKNGMQRTVVPKSESDGAPRPEWLSTEEEPWSGKYVLTMQPWKRIYGMEARILHNAAFWAAYYPLFEQEADSARPVNFWYLRKLTKCLLSIIASMGRLIRRYMSGSKRQLRHDFLEKYLANREIGGFDLVKCLSDVIHWHSDGAGESDSAGAPAEQEGDASDNEENDGDAAEMENDEREYRGEEEEEEEEEEEGPPPNKRVRTAAV